MKAEVAEKAEFNSIRYAQCWEDADVLLEGLDIQPGDTCLSIASAGDNALAMLAKSPARVVALDLSLAQLAALELRVAAYRTLSHPELLALLGSADSENRSELYLRCRPYLSENAREFWDKRPEEIAKGIGGIGKFEKYLSLFRNDILPRIHSAKTIAYFLENHAPDERERLYHEKWNTWRWRFFFKIFFSRFVMGKLGRDPSFFDYVKHQVSPRILARAHHAFTKLNPHENPYLQWILTGKHPGALPFALREENFNRIRENLHALEWRRQSLEEYLEGKTREIDRFNLSDIFEYMSRENYASLLEKIIQAGKPGGRLVYWNMMVLRKRPESLAEKLKELDDLSRSLHLKDKAFFYSGIVVEEIR